MHGVVSHSVSLLIIGFLQQKLRILATAVPILIFWQK